MLGSQHEKTIPVELRNSDERMLYWKGAELWCSVLESSKGEGKVPHLPRFLFVHHTLVVHACARQDALDILRAPAKEAVRRGMCVCF